MSDNKIGPIDSILYIISGGGKGIPSGENGGQTGAVKAGGSNIFGGNSSVGSELSAFKTELQKFSAGKNVERSGIGQPISNTNDYAQDQDLYNRVSNIPSCDSFANMDDDQRRTLCFA